MAEVDVEKKDGSNGKKKTSLWIWAIVAIIAIIILWLAFDPRTDVHRTENDRIPDSTIIREDTSPPDFE